MNEKIFQQIVGSAQIGTALLLIAAALWFLVFRIWDRYDEKHNC